MFARIICAATPQQDKGRGGGRRRRRERESKGTLNESKPFIHSSSMGLCLSSLFFAFGPNQGSSFVCDVQVR
jgi:hypothetical protein